MNAIYLCDSLGNKSNGGTSLSGETFLSFLLSEFNNVTVITDQLVNAPKDNKQYKVIKVKREIAITRYTLIEGIKFFIKSLINLPRRTELSFELEDDTVLFCNSFLSFSERIKFKKNSFKLLKVIIIRGDTNSFRYQPFLNLDCPQKIASDYLDFFDDFIFVSSTTKKNWKKYLPSSKKTHLLFNSVDEKAIAKEYSSPFVSNNFNVVVLGSVQKRKGQDLLKIIAKQFRDQINFHLVGNISDQSGGTEIFNELKHESNVFFHGHSDSPFAYLQFSDAALSLSRSEAFPRVIAEYMANSCLIISTNVSGADEMIQHGKNGFLVEIDDVGSIIECLKLAQKNDYSLFKKQARIDYDEKYSLKNQNRAFKKIVRELNV